jgi:hypothetical protein
METPSVDPPETRLGPEADVRIHQQGTHCLAIPEACAVPELFAIGISVTRPGDPSRRNGNAKGPPFVCCGVTYTPHLHTKTPDGRKLRHRAYSGHKDDPWVDHLGET